MPSKFGILPSSESERQGEDRRGDVPKNKRGSGFLRCPFGQNSLRQQVDRYLRSAFRLAAPPSGTSTSNSTFLPFPTNGCQATTLCLPAGTSLISKVPSSFTTAK